MHMRDPLSTTSPASRRVDDVIRGPIKSKTIFPVLLLHLIREHPDHGYGLMQRIEAVCGDLIAVNTNKIYPLLRRLEERGFVTATWDHPTKRSRRIYAITPSGEERLAKIKGAMLPYLDSIERAVVRLKKRLYEQAVRAVSGARSSA
jgi:PadR family transcriptional regulator, regulatory protein PadR